MASSSEAKGLDQTSDQHAVVLSVEEVAKSTLSSPSTNYSKIPENYIRLDQEPPAIFDKTSFQTIPTIDMKELLFIEDADQESNLELHKLYSTCKEWGIFQLVNHGVSSSLLSDLNHEIEDFFALSLEEKMKHKIRHGDVEGYGTVVRSKDQKLDWGDRFYMIINPIHRRKPHLFPKLPSSLREVLEKYIVELRKVAMMILELLGRGMKMEKREIIKEVFEDGMQSIRMTYYPPCSQPELVMGLTPHSDATGVTILHQVNGVEGFQVKRDGVWSTVNFLPNAFVINVGDILEMMSNGVYKSIEHRAAVNSEKGRISIAMFFNPKFEVEIGPVFGMIDPQNPPRYRRIGMEQYVKDFFSRSLNGKSHLERMKID